ncbi:hypothetical protein PIB30_000017 [Stylosanthes scabra]|uniref:Uncharacterized protein n=1 Tax=Stylosanthes scabra TaxID=79078 RepID=A0ABU6Q374_9FABA|nr:hypothetical protein [Stylosanthes scabra]
MTRPYPELRRTTTSRKVYPEENQASTIDNSFSFVGQFSTQSKRISPVSYQPKSPIFDSAKADEKSKLKGNDESLHKSSSDTSIAIDVETGAAEKDKSNLKPTFSHDSDKTVQQEVKKSAEEPFVERAPTPITQYRISAKVLNALRWLIGILNAPIEDDVNHEEIQQKVKLVIAHFHAHFAPEEATPVESVPLLVKNLLNTSSNIRKCQTRAVDLGMDLKFLDKSVSYYVLLKTRLSTEINSANEKLSGLDQQKAKLEEELASIQHQIKEVEDQKKKLGVLSTVLSRDWRRPMANFHQLPNKRRKSENNSLK